MLSSYCVERDLDSLHVSLGSLVLFVGGGGGWVEVGKAGGTAGLAEGAGRESVVQTLIDRQWLVRPAARSCCVCACVRAYLNLVPTTMVHGDERDSVGVFSVETVVSPGMSYRGFGPVKCMFQETQTEGQAGMTAFLDTRPLSIGRRKRCP